MRHLLLFVRAIGNIVEARILKELFDALLQVLVPVSRRWRHATNLRHRLVVIETRALTPDQAAGTRRAIQRLLNLFHVARGSRVVAQRWRTTATRQQRILRVAGGASVLVLM